MKKRDTNEISVPNSPKHTTHPNNRNRIKIISVIVIIASIATIVFVFLSQINLDLVNFYLRFNGIAEERINYIAFHEVGNESNQTLLINKILRWEKENIVDLYINETYPCQLYRLPSDNILLQDKHWTSITMCGKCGEFAGMFSELANRLRIENKVIMADNINGGNHAWVEIIQGNETIPIWTSDLKDYDISKFYDWYNASKFYDCNFMIKYRNINNGLEDISKKYYNWCS